ncbi:nucleotide sugar dehydrogenase [Halopseudomonas pachastrellae]|uniref:nucleotide sugar dehydrogenase n=1 Tax=Halopseudomonas pachastrellae TaxID=254161 RepID=UPI003D7E0455
MHIDLYGDTLSALVTAGSLASTGHNVVLRMPQGRVRQQIIANKAAYSEPGLRRLISDGHTSGRLVYGDFDGLPGADSRAVFLALDTHESALAEKIVGRLSQIPDRGWLVVNQSPFAVGFTEHLESLLCTDGGATRRSVVALPDFLQEGTALDGMLKPPQIILGCSDGHAELLVKEIFRPFNRDRDHFLVMSPREAEFTKLAITGMLVTRISFMNDMANLADSLGIDIENVRQGVAADPRIGPAYLYPGVGFGGPGFSTNVINLVDTLDASGVGSSLLNQVIEINERQKEYLFRRLWQHYHTDLKGRTVAIWGAAFKPETGRIDNAPIIRILEALWAQGAKARVHDPEALPALLERFGHHPGLHYASHPYAAADGADALLVLTQWKAYWSPDLDRLRKGMKQPVIFDGRNMYDPAYMREHGFTYYGVGR